MMNQNTVTPQSQNRILVTQRTPDGYCIYDPQDSQTQYFVQGTPDNPRCSCMENQNNPTFRCEHIAAVYGGQTTDMNEPVPPQGTTQQLPATQPGTYSPQMHNNGAISEPPTKMHIKRSMSPDGKIDSLSVEFLHPVELMDCNAVIQQAHYTMGLQDQIFNMFLGQHAQPASQQSSSQQTQHPQSTIVQLTHITGRQTRYGWRMYINVRLNGQNVMLFGNKDKLRDYIIAAGYPQLSNDIREGSQLNVQCRAVVKHDGNSNYPSIEQLLPLNGTHS